MPNRHVYNVRFIPACAGNSRGFCRRQVAVNRFIPACAGNRKVNAPRSCWPSVHPRVCGEQKRFNPAGKVPDGSSPRVRGTVTERLGRVDPVRFIPACAGNRKVNAPRSCWPSVHPRVCGEQGYGFRRSCLMSGSSPRVRGTVRHPFLAVGMQRFIPACAGNSVSSGVSTASGPVHPRVCGEQFGALPKSELHRGSSPRVRGTVIGRDALHFRVRFIPACAGNSSRRPKFTLGESVHPRVCGEQLEYLHHPETSTGSSPRVRGTDRPDWSIWGNPRFIPACAGNRSERIFASSAATVHPRVCGEQRSGANATGQSTGSSPRVRGTVLPVATNPLGSRFIPACAGNRSHLALRTCFESVHPRVCGEQTAIPDRFRSWFGSSPRVRGTARMLRWHLSRRRFIPACAGNSPDGRDSQQYEPVHPRVCGEQSRK